MTTLLIVRTAAGRRRVCDARCHNATARQTRCICGGLFRGAQDPSDDLRDAVRASAGPALLRLAQLEGAGLLRIVAWREELDGPLLYRDRPRLVVREEQLELFPASA